MVGSECAYSRIASSAILIRAGNELAGVFISCRQAHV